MPSWAVCEGLVEYLKFSSKDDKTFDLSYKVCRAHTHNLMYVSLRLWWSELPDLGCRPYFLRWLCSDIIVNNLLWRNTQHTIKDNFVLPGSQNRLLQWAHLSRFVGRFEDDQVHSNRGTGL